MREWRRGDLVPWNGKVLEVWSNYGGIIRLGYLGDPTYYPELDVSPDAIMKEIAAAAKFKVGDLVKRGEPWYGVTGRTWSTKKGCVLYDLLEWGAKGGHRMDVEHGVPEGELVKVWEAEVPTISPTPIQG